MKIIIITIGLVFAWVGSAYAACGGSSPNWTAATVSQADVADCISLAAVNDTITLPSGTATWSSKLIPAKTLIFRGQSDYSTWIIDYGFSTTATNTTFDIGYINFKNVNIASGGSSGGPGLAINVGCTTSNQVFGWRAHDNKFYDYPSGAITTCNSSYGLIDNNYFYSGNNSDALIYVNGRNSTDWALSSFLGSTGNYTFVEDNKFYCGSLSSNCLHTMYSQWGASYVYRCNSIESVGSSHYWGDALDVHGGGAGSHTRGTRQFEFYGNKFIQRGYESRAINIRGGTGRVFSNVFDESGGYGIATIFLQDYRSIVGGYSLYAPTNTSDCSTNTLLCSVEATCCIDNEGYPCCDQIGQIQDGGGRQIASPLYTWNNKTSSGTDVDVTVSTSGTTTTIIQLNRDYFNGTIPGGYSPYTYPHPSRGLSTTTTCLSDSNSQAKTAISFWSAATYTITASAGANGSINPTGSVLVSSGTATAFTVTPNGGYTASVGGSCGGSIMGTTYTTSTITGDCTVTANFNATSSALSGRSQGVKFTGVISR